MNGKGLGGLPLHVENAGLPALFVNEVDKIVHFVKFVIYLCAGNFRVPLNGWVEIAFS